MAKSKEPFTIVYEAKSKETHQNFNYRATDGAILKEMVAREPCHDCIAKSKEIRVAAGIWQRTQCETEKILVKL